ncbi:hypothetical protein GYMLUDRAFT_236586 [Collybiopsis luxurians FD-317 M1]|nr:hypothetical protein GYMLUDRAFT_236586 [Collybiopsis luxurians FD-317 M1]
MAHDAIDEFVQNPKEFLTPSTPGPRTLTAVSPFDMFKDFKTINPNVIHRGYFEFMLVYESDNTRAKSRTFEIRYHGERHGPHTVEAYNLGFNGRSLTSRKPAFVDIPKRPQGNDPTLLFTGTLTGCSVIVTSLNANTYRVFHDPRGESSIFYDNVEMGVDFSYYDRKEGRYTTESGSDVSAACVFMQYRDNQWNMFVQLQTFTFVEDKKDKTKVQSFIIPRRIEGLGREYSNLSIFKPGSYDAGHAKGDFQHLRETTQQKLKGYISQAFPTFRIPDVPDGTFQPFEANRVDLQNPAVKHFQTIRDALRQHIAAVPPPAKFKPLDVPQLHNMSFQKFMSLAISDTESLDVTYLWLKQKEKRGFREVVITDDRLEAPLGSTAGERFTGRQLDELLTANKDFSDGYDKYHTVHIPNFSSSMSSLEMIMLFDKSSSFTQAQMGALVHHIKDKSEREFKTSVWHRTDEIVRMFQKAGGITKPMPQDLILNAVPDEYVGRCYPLVRAMSVALAQSDLSAVDQLGIKLVALSPSSKTDLMNAELFRRCLKDLHASFPAAAASTPIGSTNLRNAVNKLSADSGKSTVFALNTNKHAMLLGATNRGGKTSYHFYDPNFAIATFASKEQLLTAVTKFFTDTDFKFADVYGADGSASEPVFDLVKLDTDKMAQISFDFKLTVADFSDSKTLLETASVRAIFEQYT